jgi:hypothetical protein
LPIWFGFGCVQFGGKKMMEEKKYILRIKSKKKEKSKKVI